MNLRLFTIAFLLALLPFKMSFAHDSKSTLTKADFSHAEESIKDGKSLVELDLSQNGMEKVKHLNQSQVGKKVSLVLAGKEHSLTLRVPIADDKIQAGPFTHSEAQKIVDEINKK
ncbi:MAG: hypothetical protein ACXWRE_09075 [Pseudobdellovibrionaceae bacterium]